MRLARVVAATREPRRGEPPPARGQQVSRPSSRSLMAPVAPRPTDRTRDRRDLKASVSERSTPYANVVRMRNGWCLWGLTAARWFLKRALRMPNSTSLQIWAIAAELPRVGLEDALEILLALPEREPESFSRNAAARGQPIRDGDKAHPVATAGVTDKGPRCRSRASATDARAPRYRDSRLAASPLRSRKHPKRDSTCQLGQNQAG